MSPTNATNLELILQCIEWNLNQITAANGYYTDGMLVDVDRDPRALREDKPEIYRRKGAAVTLGLGKRTKDPKVTGGRRRYRQQYVLKGINTLTASQDQAGLKLYQVTSRIHSDIVNRFELDFKFPRAAAALGIPIPCVTYHIIDAFEQDEGSFFPDALWIADGSFIYDEASNVGGE